MNRSVDKIIPPPPHHWVGNGFKVHTFFPTSALSMQRISPFLMLDYNAKMTLAPTDTPRGVDVHPHRGFQTVSLVLHGAIAHHDSYGNKGVIHKGDVQWMSAASGVLHKEYHDVEFSKQGGDYQMVQLWVNLPSAFKMAAPTYQEIQNKNMPTHTFENGSTLKIIAGSYAELTSETHTYSPIFMYLIDLKPNDPIPLAFNKDFNTCMLCVSGNFIINDTEIIATDYFALMANDEEHFLISTPTYASVLVLSGAPIAEPIASYGPFVMNTKEEIQQAILDYNEGKFGQLE